MFGILRPCRNRLPAELRDRWLGHLCGMCLALRDEHGQLARLVTNYDAVAISALVEAQAGSQDGRRAGPCALRGMRRAEVVTGDAAQLAAAVSLLLAAATLTDHVADGDLAGPIRLRAARTMARRWASAGDRTGDGVGLDGSALLATIARQTEAERDPASLLAVTAPTEAATGAAFRQTALVAGCPGNAEPLAEAGRLFGRLAHLLDAVEDLAADRAAGRWNPLIEFGLGPQQVRALCDDAVLGVRLALREAKFVDPTLVHALLVHELAAAAARTFAAATTPAPPQWPRLPRPTEPGPDDAPDDDPGWDPDPVKPYQRPKAVGICLAWLAVCGTCRLCCADEWTNPCTGSRESGWCRGTDCCECADCAGDGCEGCAECCDCCGGC